MSTAGRTIATRCCGPVITGRLYRGGQRRRDAIGCYWHHRSRVSCLPASELLQEAVRVELHRQELLEQTDTYLAALVAEIGEPSARELARAEAIAQRLRDHTPSRQADRNVLVLDSGGVSRLAERSTRAAALITVFKREGLWPPVVPSIVLVECLSGPLDRDARTNHFLKTCDVQVVLPEARARRAAHIRSLAGRGSAVDATVVAAAEPSGTVYGADIGDLRGLAAHADDVAVEH